MIETGLRATAPPTAPEGHRHLGRVGRAGETGIERGRDLAERAGILGPPRVDRRSAPVVGQVAAGQDGGAGSVALPDEQERPERARMAGEEDAGHGVVLPLEWTGGGGRPSDAQRWWTA
jgi:hypothetical protein